MYFRCFQKLQRVWICCHNDDLLYHLVFEVGGIWTGMTYGNITIFLVKDRLLFIYQMYSSQLQSGGIYAKMNRRSGPILLIFIGNNAIYVVVFQWHVSIFLFITYYLFLFIIFFAETSWILEVRLCFRSWWVSFVYTLWVLLVFIMEGTSCIQSEHVQLHVTTCTWTWRGFDYLMIF